MSIEYLIITIYYAHLIWSENSKKESKNFEPMFIPWATGPLQCFSHNPVQQRHANKSLSNFFEKECISRIRQFFVKAGKKQWIF